VFTVRKFHPSDLFSIIKLTIDSLTERYDSSLFNYFYETFPDGFWVYEKHHKIVGFIVGIKINSEIARILMLVVSKNYRKKGIGNTLLTHLLKILTIKNIKQVELEVKISNKSAIDFYRKHGFELKKVLNNFYQNGEDAYIMRLII
jgi:ribosomal-protein-alanine N-acetyltransferase